MKTKKFLLATSGATVDGRTIDPDWLRQMARNYDPKTYGARLNIEHIRGISGDKPFRAYGDVLALSVVEDHEVTIAGKPEKRTALFGTFDVTEDAQKLNQANQKVYPSIEIDPNFAGKGEAYLMGCALTDSPAAIGTDRMTFNRHLPGNQTVTEAELSAVLEFPEPDPAVDSAAQEVKGFFSKLTEVLSRAAPKPEEKPAQQPTAPEAGAFDPANFVKELGETLGTAMEKQASANKAMFDQLDTRFSALEKLVEETEEPGHRQRPPATGPGTHGQGYSLNDIF